MRILLLNQYFAPDTAATAQLLGDLAHHLAAHDHQIHVVCSARTYRGSTKLPRHETHHNLHIHRVPACGFGRRNLLSRLLDYASFPPLAALKLLRLPRFDAILCLTTPPLLIHLPLLFTRAPVALWSMDVYPQLAAALNAMRPRSLPYKLTQRLAQRGYRKATHIIALADDMRQQLLHLGVDPQKISTVHNWAPGNIQPAPPPPNPPLTLLYSGNMGRGHEFQTLLDALKNLPDIHLTLRGHGTHKQHLQQTCAQHHIPLKLQPPAPLNQLSSALADAHLHLVSQLPGTQGLLVPSKVYGSLAAARPILYIGPPNTEIDRLIQTAQCGWSFRPGQTQPLRHLLTHLDLHTLQQRGNAGHTYYQQHLGRQRSLNQITTILERLAT